ncbi:MAG: hypothetical protein A2096_02980 [Spirochaetes bacterium GWF1_41_5]|nr:MAG: hypothetical protein A2096_02980 [Spirochaetes bacterium GWF1_41_5]HBE01435.1 hypothetical protein [Spirochaetia bacterium]
MLPLNFNEPSLTDTLAIFQKLSGLNISMHFETDFISENFKHKDPFFLAKDGHKNCYCELIKDSPQSKGCEKYDEKVRKVKAKLFGMPFVDECPFGVKEIIIPFIYNNKYAATLFCGQILNEKNREKSFFKIWKKIRYKKINKQLLWKAFNNFIYYPPIVLNQMANLLYNALRSISMDMNNHSIEQFILLDKNPIIKNILKKLEESGTEIPKASKIAKDLGITSEYLSRIFKKVMRTNYIDYIAELRISRAKQLLATTNLTITKISAMSGYTRPSYFAKKFREYNYVSPKQFRKLILHKTKKF